MSFPPPSVVPPTLASWQFSLNGFTFGAGTTAGILQVQGLGDLPTIRTADVTRPRDQGELIGLDLYGGRDIQIDLWAQPDNISLADTLLNLAAATEIGFTTEQPLWFQVPNYPLLACMCRPRKRAVPWNSAEFAAASRASPVVQLHATDPRLYTAASTATVGLPTPAVGLTFPVTFPVTFGATGPNGVTVTNSGNTEMRPTLTITGPCTNPAIANASITGTPVLTFKNPTQTSYTVNTGDQMVVDLDLHTITYYVGGVIAGDGADRANWLVSGSTWWDLPPGANLIQFNSGDSMAVGGTVTVAYASAYII